MTYSPRNDDDPRIDRAEHERDFPLESDLDYYSARAADRYERAMFGEW